MAAKTCSTKPRKMVLRNFGRTLFLMVWMARTAVRAAWASRRRVREVGKMEEEGARSHSVVLSGLVVVVLEVPVLPVVTSVVVFVPEVVVGVVIGPVVVVVVEIVVVEVVVGMRPKPPNMLIPLRFLVVQLHSTPPSTASGVQVLPCFPCTSHCSHVVLTWCRWCKCRWG